MMRKYRTNPVKLARFAPHAKLAVCGGPVTADEIAVRLGIICETQTDPREARRRIVRDLVAWLREHGEMVCANTIDGYWMARDWSEYRLYQEAERSGAVFKFVRLRDEREAARERHNGQVMMFDTRNTEWATR